MSHLTLSENHISTPDYHSDIGQKLVSVVIPCYNQGKFLQETVPSVLNSTYKPLEIIIVNDGSTDDSLEIIKEIAKKNTGVYYINQSNKGPSEARNVGIEFANGEYILPLDGDDKIHPEYISRAVEVISSDANIKVVYCQAEKFGRKSGKWNLQNFSHQALATENMIFVSALFHKSDWEAVGGFDVAMEEGWEDWEFWISMLKDGGKAVQLPITGFYYRIHSASRRKSFCSEAKKQAITYLNKKHGDFFWKYINGPLRVKRSVSKYYNRMAHLFFL
ncbi:glycosyltransferase family 2 protein [Pararhodonellum marinum]|uniref:glycosyltransferase family 2 protein n=1 Tax=Pararhodonellum marinum TaxID=2755358 RepID=UPI00188E7E83|nr:glycosyltransferase family A protein [Pararhodonellum marinum]